MNLSLFDGRSISCGFSSRADGSLRLPYDVASRDSLLQNRERYFSANALPSSRIVSADLVHGTNVRLVDDRLAGQTVPATDGLCTRTSNLVLSVTGSDCFPIYFFDPVRHAIALVHAGWQGIAGNIVAATVEAMRRSFESSSEDLRVGIGPGLRSCHFQVQADVLPRFVSHLSAIQSRDEGTFVDLPAILRDQLRTAGVLDERVEDCGECTFCLSDRYFSFRRDRPPVPEAMAAWMVLK